MGAEISCYYCEANHAHYRYKLNHENFKLIDSMTDNNEMWYEIEKLKNEIDYIFGHVRAARAGIIENINGKEERSIKLQMFSFLCEKCHQNLIYIHLIPKGWDVKIEYSEKGYFQK